MNDGPWIIFRGFAVARTPRHVYDKEEEPKTNQGPADGDEKLCFRPSRQFQIVIDPAREIQIPRNAHARDLGEQPDLPKPKVGIGHPLTIRPTERSALARLATAATWSASRAWRKPIRNPRKSTSIMATLGLVWGAIRRTIEAALGRGKSRGESL